MNGHWKEFYSVFKDVLLRFGKQDIVQKLQEEQAHKGSLTEISELFTRNGFKISQQIEDKFEMRFLNGTAFLNHHFIQAGWLASWQNIIPKEEHPALFKQLEKVLNAYAIRHGELQLTVPIAFIEGEKV